MAEPLVPPPSEEEYNRGSRVQTDTGGISSYIPPELKQTGRNVLDLANMMDPVQGIMAAMRDSGRAFDSDLSPEERKRAAASAGLETLYGATPLAIAKLMKAPAKAAVVDALTLTGSPSSMADDIDDPSRRAFMKGAAATAGVAALAPEAITEALEKVPAAVKRVRGGGHIAEVLDAVSKSRGAADELYEKTRELSAKINPYVAGSKKTNLPIQVDDKEVVETFEAMKQTRELQEEAGRLQSVSDSNLMDLLSSIRNSPKILDDARDEDLEYFLEELDHFPFGIGERLEDPEFADIYEEIKKRGLDQRKNKDGVNEYPYSNTFVLDYEEGILGDGPITPKRFDSPVLKMTDRASIPVEDLVKGDQEDRFREIIRQELVKEFEIGKQKGLSQEEIDDAVALKRYSLEKKYGIDFSKADGGEMRKGVGSLSEIARRMNEGGEVFIPTQEDLDDMAARVERQYGFDPVATAIEEGVDPDLALRIMMRESSGDHSKGSDAGAIGLMGLMAITAKDVGVDRTDPLQNFVGGLRYLKKMQKRFGPIEGLAAYNAGPTAVEKYGGIPPFKETQDYVRSILTPHTGVDYENEIQTDAETALMQMPVQPASQATRPRARPVDLAPVFETDFNESLRPMARPPQEEIQAETSEPQMPVSLQAKYSPEGIEQMLIGTTAEPLLPKQFQQGSLSGVGR